MLNLGRLSEKRTDQFPPPCISRRFPKRHHMILDAVPADDEPEPVRELDGLIQREAAATLGTFEQRRRLADGFDEALLRSAGDLDSGDLEYHQMSLFDLQGRWTP